MSIKDTFGEQRRGERRRPLFTTPVTNVISGEPFGYLGNLSANGMLLISPHAPRSEGVYQVSFLLSESGTSPDPPRPIEFGIQEQWHQPAASPGQVWSGYKVIAISDEDLTRLEHWLKHG